MSGKQVRMIVLLLAALMAGQAAEPSPPMQIFATMIVDHSLDAPNVIFDVRPSIRDPKDVAELRVAKDGYSLVVCKGVTVSRHLSGCSPGRWVGTSERLDGIGMRALRSAVVGKEQAARFRAHGGRFYITMRFSDSNEPLSPCPAMICRYEPGSSTR